MSPFSLIFLNTLVIVSLTALTFLFFHRFRKVFGSAIGEKDLPFVSVIVPARNEELKIARCLESLAKQDYPRFEIVVIDDRSTDSTGEIIQKLANKYARINLIKGRETPTGWAGKCNALVQAVPHASGEWLLFTDADTCHAPHSIRHSINFALRNKTDLVSFMPMQELHSFWERVVMPVLLGSFLVGDPLNTVNDPKAERAYAYGQDMLIRRDVYEAVDGHKSVHDQILDDIMLARTVKGKGYQIMAADGTPLYSVRMYQNFETLWYGWTKNAYALIECNPAYLFLVLVLINACIIGPFAHLALLLSWAGSGAYPVAYNWMIGCVIVEFITLFGWYMNNRYQYNGIYWYHFFLLPLGSITVTAIYLTSAYLVLSGNNVSWKGRKYRVNSHKTIEPDRETPLLAPVSASTRPGANAVPMAKGSFNSSAVDD